MKISRFLPSSEATQETNLAACAFAPDSYKIQLTASFFCQILEVTITKPSHNKLNFRLFCGILKH